MFKLVMTLKIMKKRIKPGENVCLSPQSDTNDVSAALCSDVQSVTLEPQQNKYSVKPQRELKSRFVTQQEKKKHEAEAALLQKQTPQEVTSLTQQTGASAMLDMTAESVDL